VTCEVYKAKNKKTNRKQNHKNPVEQQDMFNLDHIKPSLFRSRKETHYWSSLHRILINILSKILVGNLIG
jgi:hypothetical protein